MKTAAFSFPRCAVAAVAALLALAPARAWDYAGHRVVNQLALAGLPEDFPAFVRTPEAAERIAFLAGEPDRWRNNPEPGLQHATYPDHYLDLEYLPRVGIDPRKLTPFRNEFVVAFAAGRAAHPDAMPPIEPDKNKDHTREWPGFAPWAIFENYAKLVSAMSYLRTFEAYGGTPAEIENARANVVAIMGTMGHFVGDLAQPLHSTEHHNGWVGPNPEGFTTEKSIHSWIDGGFVRETGLGLADVQAQARPAQTLPAGTAEDGRPRVFLAILDYLFAQHDLVVPLYRLEKEGAFKPELPVSSRGREFVTRQWLTGGEMLSSLWLTAWRSAIPDTYLMQQLQQRAAKAEEAKKPTGT